MKENNSSLRVAYFGTYRRDCSRCKRNAVLIDGLRANGVEVVECNIPIWARKDYKGEVISGFLSKVKLFFKIIKSYISLVFLYKRSGRFDALIIAYPGYFDIFLARLLVLFSKTKVILDSYISLYEMAVLDRKIFSPKSIIAKIVYQIEKLGCRLADLVIVETDQYVDFYHSFFGLNKNKLMSLLSSANNKIFYPRAASKDGGRFEILYYGSFIPMHGLEYVIEAAKYLKDYDDIVFRFVGDGQMKSKIQERLNEADLKNIILDRWYESEELCDVIANADVCLGIFGDSDKTKRCFTNKVCDALAMQKAIITCDSPTTRQLFTSGVHMILCPPANARALAEAALYLKDNPQKLREIAEAGHRLYLERLSPLKIGGELKNKIVALCKGWLLKERLRL